MAVQEIVLYAQNPGPLRKKSKPAKGVNQHTQKLIQDLKNTLNAHPRSYHNRPMAVKGCF